MSIILDPAQPVSYTPREGGPTYLLRPPTVADRNRYQENLGAEGAKFHPQLSLMDLARAAVLRFTPNKSDASARAEAMAIIDRYCDRLRTAIAERQADETEATDKEFTEAVPFPDDLEDLIEVLRPDHALRRALGQNAGYWNKAGTEAARLLLIGWEGLGTFKRGLGGLPEETLNQIDPNDLAMIGVRVEQLMRPDEARLKNSNSASSGRSGETKSSSVGKTIRRNGHSQTETATA